MGLPLLLLLLLLLTGGGAPTEGALCGIAASGLGGLSPAQRARPAGVVKNCVSSAPDLQVAPYEARAYRVMNAAAAVCALCFVLCALCFVLCVCVLLLLCVVVVCLRVGCL